MRLLVFVPKTPLQDWVPYKHHNCFIFMGFEFGMNFNFESVLVLLLVDSTIEKWGRSWEGGNVHACETASDWSATMVHVIFSCDVTEPRGEPKRNFFRYSQCVSSSPVFGTCWSCVCKCVSVSCVSNLNLIGRHFFVCDKKKKKKSPQNTHTRTHTPN
jgi:hypothetical protein